MWLYFWNINDEKKKVSPKWPFINTLPPPFTSQKKSVPPFCHENYGWEKHVNSIFTGKVCGNFFSRPKILSQSPPFCTRPLLTSVCERSLKHPAKWATKIFPKPKPQCCGIFNIFRSRRTYIFVCHACLFTFYCDQLFPVLPFNFACFCEILYVAYSAVDVCFYLVSYIVYISATR